MALTHVLLVKHVDEEKDDSRLAATIAQWRRLHVAAFADIHAHRGLQTADAYVYFELATAGEWSLADRRAFEETFLTETAPLAVDRLECMLDVPGATIDARRSLHYVVETDAAEGSWGEMQRWYDTEHMPGLARVTGCIRARRFINHDHGPRSFARYDLAVAGVTETPAWLAVRSTPWSSHVRPQFRNTRRTMFRDVASQAR